MLTIVAGGAGFVGFNLCKRLLEMGADVFVIDNFSRGQIEYLQRLKSIYNSFVWVEADLSSASECARAFDQAAVICPIHEVWHLAANSDIPAGILDSNIDLKNTFLTTFNLLQEVKRFNIGLFNFASSSAIYGDFGGTPIHENIGPLLPISNYGAMKLASEAIISAAVESYLDRANIFRFPNVVGVPATHGVILDFISKLIDTPNSLTVLGDGSQQKAYLHVSDLIEAMLFVRSMKLQKKIEVVNIGPIDQGITVKSIAELVVERLSPFAQIKYGKGNKGWVGDVSRFTYSTLRLQSYGWSPKLNSREAVSRAINEIAIQLGR